MRRRPQDDCPDVRTSILINAGRRSAPPTNDPLTRGAAAHGAAPPLVVGLGDERFRILFPMVVLFVLLAAVWPLRVAAPAARPLPSAG